MIAKFFPIVVLALFLSGCSLDSSFQKRGECNAYEDLAKEGELYATIQIANCYRTGRGRVKNIDTATDWYQLAAAKDSHVAMNALGAIYLFESENPKLYPEGIALLENASELGNIRSHFSLGLALLNGLGVGRDSQKAMDYFRGISRDHEASALVLFLAYCLGEYSIEVNPLQCREQQKQISSYHKIDTTDKVHAIVSEFMEHDLFDRYVLVDRKILSRIESYEWTDS